MKYFAKIILLTLCLISTSCEQATTQPDDDVGQTGSVSISLRFDPSILPSATTDSVKISVSADDMDAAFFQIELGFFITTGTLSGIPVGVDRRFTIEWSDDNDELAYSGEATLDIYVDSTIALEQTILIVPYRGFNLLGPGIHNIVVNSAGRLFSGSFTIGLIISDTDGLNWYRPDLPTGMLPYTAISPGGHIYYRFTNSPSLSNTAYLSTDGGENWDLLYERGDFRTFAFGPNDDLYVGSTSGVFRSVNGGAEWTDLGLEAVTNLSADISAMAANNAGYIFVGVSRPGAGSFFRYSPVDFQWTELPLNNDTEKIVFGPDSMVFVSHPAPIGIGGDGFDFGRTGGISKSPDFGKSWFGDDSTNVDFIGQKIENLASNSAGTVFAAIRDGQIIDGTSPRPAGIYRYNTTTDDWTLMLATNVLAMAISPTDEIYVVLWHGGIVRSTDNGVTWQ